jgi:hypothetical protein
VREKSPYPQGSCKFLIFKGNLLEEVVWGLHPFVQLFMNKEIKIENLQKGLNPRPLEVKEFYHCTTIYYKNNWCKTFLTVQV